MRERLHLWGLCCLIGPYLGDGTRKRAGDPVYRLRGAAET
jgi:hypothetical protein